MCVCACVYTYIFTCIHIHEYIYIYAYIYIHIYVYTIHTDTLTPTPDEVNKADRATPEVRMKSNVLSTTSRQKRLLVVLLLCNVWYIAYEAYSIRSLRTVSCAQDPNDVYISCMCTRHDVCMRDEGYVSSMYTRHVSHQVRIRDIKHDT
jgi:hypothetical protein